ncbi:MAG: hypothetical protein AB7G62_17765, partial [Magnetospirillum sp.]
MPAPHHPLHPGDTFRVDRGFPRRRMDEDVIDFLRVHYETDSPGLGHVVEVRDDGFTFELWGHLFTTLSDVSTRGTKPGIYVTEDFWLIVVTEGNEDETEIYCAEIRRRA